MSKMHTEVLLTLLICASICGNCYSLKPECIQYTRNASHTIYQMLVAGVPSQPENKVKFYLFTRKNPSCYQELILDDSKSILNSNLNAIWPTRFIIHGFKNDYRSNINDLLRAAYLEKGNFNVILVEWGEIAYNLNYDHVTQMVAVVGGVLAKFATFLFNTKRIKFNNMYFIGHSLGAHVAGIAGHKTPQKINTIFALDPAEPNFKNAPLENRIDSSDATYVEAIHTDIGFLGFTNPVGHADFYPNFGKRQKGCEFTLKTCSHARAFKYFYESINSKEGFWSVPCANLSQILQGKCLYSGEEMLMGGEPATPKKGVFYVPINSKANFAKGRVYV